MSIGVCVLIVTIAVIFTPIHTYAQAQEGVVIDYTQKQVLQEKIKDLENLLARLRILIAKNHSFQQVVPTQSKTIVIVRKKINPARSAVAPIQLKTATITREKSGVIKNSWIFGETEKVTTAIPKIVTRKKSSKKSSTRKKITPTPTPTKSVAPQEIAQKESAQQKENIEKGNEKKESNAKKVSVPTEKIQQHAHSNIFFADIPAKKPGNAKHAVSFAGVIDQNVVVTLRDAMGNIVDVIEGTDTVNFSNLIDSEEYTITAETEGHCSKSREVSNLNKETVITFEEIEEDVYTYRWESDLKNKEYECSSHPVKQNEIQFKDTTLIVSNISPVQVLAEEYNIVLSNEKITWSSGLARGLLRVVSSIPHKKTSQTKFVLTDQEIENDIRVDKDAVYMSKHAFNHTNPRMVLLNGKKGTLFSHRAFQALTRFYTKNGTDRKAAEKIFNEKFGVSTHPKNVEALTGEHPDNFQKFQNEEILDLISAFAETPEGQYTIPGLAYLLRRKDGHPHPLYPGAPAVAWPRGSNINGYIEFMETAFYYPKTKSKMSEMYVYHLILHEKSHFLWENVLSNTLRQEWISTAGWYQNADDVDGWSNRYTTTFVSPYAHKVNPNEDLAETIASYITNPNRLRNVSPEKYEFVRKYIMHGNEYIADIRADLRFEVLNLFPDYDYPGKIKGVSVIAQGTPLEDKKVIIEITLNNVAGYNDGAHWARTRLVSKSGLFKDVYMYPVGDGNTHRLRGTLTIPKNSESGYWRPDQITVKDLSGNTRTEGIVDFGFMLYINNASEDLVAPEYVPNSLAIQVEKTEMKGREVHKVTATWDIQEEVGMKARDGVYANFVSLSNPEAYSWGEYGEVHNNKAKVIFYITEYFPSGEYTINYLHMNDKALNTGTQYFSEDPKHEQQKVFTVETANPDTTLPTLDLNRISIDAVPFNEKSPDGKTRVTITYYAKDDLSGVGKVFYVLQDPNGKTISGTHYHENFYTPFFEGGDPTADKKYVAKHILPSGSAPGTWGLREMIIEDKGGNITTSNFTEILHFQLTANPES